MIRARITETCFVGGGLRTPGEILTVRNEEYAPHVMEEVVAEEITEDEGSDPSSKVAKEPEDEAGSEESEEGSMSHTRKRVVTKKA